jgi:hypothetical protein
MLLSFDVAPEAIPEHDDWHTHEHLPERLSIPGFLRGSRWIALTGHPGYFVMYEVLQLATLTSDAYLARLNDPSPWTSRMMPFYRGMTRGFCSVTGSFGSGIGHVCLLVRFKPARGRESSLRDGLIRCVMPDLPVLRGVGSVHLFEGALTPAMTAEQRIRGADADVDWVLFVTGYAEATLADLAQAELGDAQLQARGATGVGAATYRLDYALTDREVHA